MSGHAPRRGTHAWNMLRASWQVKINAAGGWTCRRCQTLIPPGDRKAWHLGHPDDITTGPTLLRDLEPEHARCNTSAGATAGNYARHERDDLTGLPPSRKWLPTVHAWDL